ncbi:MAG: hypothetical protein JSS91_13720 [Bacteroidetes bacterium]|nr:hypothetical protein [Bacteroidota bacterium]
MAKVKRKSVKTKSKLTQMTALHAAKEYKMSNRSLDEFSVPDKEFFTTRELKSKFTQLTGKTLKLISPYLLLSARTPFVSGKGYINAIQCSSIFPGSPNISFQSYPAENVGPGKLEIWLSGLTTHQKITVEIRLGGYSFDNNSSYEVNSSLSSGTYAYFPVNSTSKIDLYFPDVQDISGQGLITVKPVNMTGTWIFYDLKVNVIE